MAEKTPFPILSLVIYQDSEFLLIRRRHAPGNVLTIPDGSIHYGETVKQAVKRELKEQFDMDVAEQRFLSLEEHIVREKRETLDHIFFLYYLVKVKHKGFMIDNPTILEAQWVHFDKIGGVNMPSSVESLLKLTKEKLEL